MIVRCHLLLSLLMARTHHDLRYGRGLLDKIKYSFTFDWPVPVKSNNGDEGENETVPTVKVDKTRLLRTVTIKPQVPLYIIYYTLFNTADGQLQSYPDIYGYDKALYEVLKLYL